jgi:hypothetical protein
MIGSEYDQNLICEKKQDPQHNTEQETGHNVFRKKQKRREENKQEMKVRIGFLRRITYL